MSLVGRRDKLAGGLCGSRLENFKSDNLFEFNTPQDCGRGEKYGEKSPKSQGEGAFCFKGLLLGSVPNFLDFLSDLKGEVLCHP